MKRTILVAAIVLFAGLSMATTDYDGPKDQPHIMATPDSGSASQSGGSSGGSKWSADVNTVNATCISESQSEGVEDISYSGEDAENSTKKVNWVGYIQTSNPCHEAGLAMIEQTGENAYRLNITTESQGGVCTQCVGMVKYEAEFSVNDPFQIEILHDGEQVKTVTYPGYNDDSGSSEPENTGAIQSLINWLSNLF